MEMEMQRQGTRLARRQGLRGFTLVELMIAVAVGAILLLLAIPSLTTMLQRNRITSATNELYATLSLARGEAVKRRGTVWVCPSADSSACRDDGDWSEGWLVFEDENNNNARDTSEPVIKAIPSTSINGNIEMNCDAEVESGVEFEPTGATLGAGTFGDFWICHSNGTASSKQITISPSGRIESTTRTQTDCSAS